MDSQGVLYKRDIEYEKQMRLSAEKKKDYELADKLRKELFDTLGVESNYLVDFYYRTIIDDKCIPILAKYIPLFKSVGISLNLITQQFWRKNNIECSNFLENWYMELKKSNALTDNIENTLDNAFVKIRDKNKISFYIEIIKDNDKFPLVMTMLGKWNIDEAKPLIISRLENDKIKTWAIRALGYYKDKNTIPLIEKHLKSEYSGVRQEAKKVIDRLNKL